MNAKIEKEEYKEAASDLASSVYFRRKGGFFFDLRSTIHDLFYDLCALAVNHF